MSLFPLLLSLTLAIAGPAQPGIERGELFEISIALEGPGTIDNPSPGGCSHGTINSDGEWICLDGSGGGSNGNPSSGTCPSSDYERTPPCPVGCNFLRQANGKCYYGGDALASTCDDGEHGH